MKPQLRISNFILQQTIGSGTFGKVKLAEHVMLREKVAIKIINRDKLKQNNQDLRTKREITIMQKLSHPHIVRLYDVVETKSHIFIIMEYISGGELFDYIVSHGRFSESEARFFFQQIVSAITYCHRIKVAHRDLKPENLLFDSKSRSIKIADFGLSNIIDDGELLQTYCGSPNYAAPEIISGQQYSGPEADVWSCGIILYALLTARLPFDDSFLPHLFKKIKDGKYIMPPYLSSDAKDLMSKILVVNPVERITTDEIWAHPWFRENLLHYLETAADPDEVKQEIVESIVNEVAVKMGVSPSQVTVDIEKALETAQVGPYFVAYQIIADIQQLSKEYRDPKNIVKDKAIASLAEFSSSPLINLRKEIPFYENNNPLSIAIDPKYPKESTETQSFWYLGYITTQQPLLIIERVLTVLKQTNFEWKICGSYQLRCRSINSSGDSNNNTPLKVGIQLYSLPKKKNTTYLLDVKVLQGSSFEFYTFCAKLFSYLGKENNTNI